MPFNIAPSDSRDLTFDDLMVSFEENEAMVKSPSIQFLHNAPNVISESRDFTLKLPSINPYPSQTISYPESPNVQSSIKLRRYEKL
jgi:hypothetical protein